jgi:hypothetical protein
VDAARGHLVEERAEALVDEQAVRAYECLIAAGCLGVEVRSFGGRLLGAVAGEPEQRRVPRSRLSEVASDTRRDSAHGGVAVQQLPQLEPPTSASHQQFLGGLHVVETPGERRATVGGVGVDTREECVDSSHPAAVHRSV